MHEYIKEENMRQSITVYIEINAEGYVTKIFSSIFEHPAETSIKIDEGFGDKYAHAQNQYLPKSLYDERGKYRYKYEGGRIYEQS